MRWLILSALVAVAALSALNWRAQLQTQQKLDALNATLAERAPASVAVAPPAEAPAPLPTLAVVPALELAPEPRPVTKAPNKLELARYIVETPDVLQIEALRAIPLPPYRLEPLDVLYVSAENTFEGAPIAGLYPVDPDGTINLGPRYGGSVRVADLDTDEALKAIEKKVRQFAPKAVVSAALAQSRSMKRITGQHIVRPDGTVNLGSYGSVYVAGLSLAQSKQAIETHLSKYLYRPEVSVDVFAFNSKFYYIITDFAGNGEQVSRLPHNGNETVLDALTQIGGLSAVGSKSVRLVRPGANGAPDQILPVKYTEIRQLGDTSTNYQLMPSDRLYLTNAVPRENGGRATPPYIIEAPDQLALEVTVKNPKTGKQDRLPVQPLSGHFAVRLDGTIGLGYWGSVSVAGLTLKQAADVIRTHIQKHEALNKFDKNPEVGAIVDVLAYNSKRYYVITDGEPEKGEQVVSFPLTGSETVLDAISNVGGLSELASKRKIWIARSSPNAGTSWQTLSVDWKAITQSGDTKTNYALQPGDRLYVKSAK